MASIWAQMKGGAERKIAGGLPSDLVLRIYATTLETWVQQAPACTVKHGIGADFLMHNGEIQGITWIEFLSPPSAAEPGQPKRTATAKR